MSAAQKAFSKCHDHKYYDIHTCAYTCAYGISMFCVDEGSILRATTVKQMQLRSVLGMMTLGSGNVETAMVPLAHPVLGKKVRQPISCSSDNYNSSLFISLLLSGIADSVQCPLNCHVTNIVKHLDMQNVDDDYTIT